MAVIQVHYLSEALMRTVDVTVILPADKIVLPGMEKSEEKPYKTLFLLHGVFGNHTDWLNGTLIQRWAEEKDLAVIMPSGENMFYLDQTATHALYGSFIGEELPRMMRRMFPLSEKREDTFLAGLSMGGYGALRNGLKYSETFGRTGAFSAALILDSFMERTDDTPFFIESRSYAEAVFGSLDKVKDSDKDPLWLLQQLKKEERPIPAVYMACGTKDSLYAVNRKYQALLEENGADVTFDEGPYGHEWDFWNLEIRRFLDWLPLEDEKEGINSGNIGI